MFPACSPTQASGSPPDHAFEVSQNFFAPEKSMSTIEECSGCSGKHRLHTCGKFKRLCNTSKQIKPSKKKKENTKGEDDEVDDSPNLPKDQSEPNWAKPVAPVGNPADMMAAISSEPVPLSPTLESSFDTIFEPPTVLALLPGGSCDLEINELAEDVGSEMTTAHVGGANRFSVKERGGKIHDAETSISTTDVRTPGTMERCTIELLTPHPVAGVTAVGQSGMLTLREKRKRSSTSFKSSVDASAAPKVFLQQDFSFESPGTCILNDGPISGVSLATHNEIRQVSARYYKCSEVFLIKR